LDVFVLDIVLDKDELLVNNCLDTYQELTAWQFFPSEKNRTFFNFRHSTVKTAVKNGFSRKFVHDVQIDFKKVDSHARRQQSSNSLESSA